MDTINIQKIEADTVAGSALILDVRRDDEWQAGHLAHAVHIPLADIEAGKVPENAKGKKLYTHCASGGRSGRAADILAQKGYDVENIGGFASLVSAGASV